MNFSKLFLSLTILFFLSCKSDVLFEEKIEIKNQTLNRSDKVVFNFDVKDTASRYDIILDVSHDLDYGFQNLYVNIHTSFPDGKTIADIVSLELSKSGTVWEGKCSGNTCTAPIVLQEHVKFKAIGDYKIVISQNSREEQIKGIQSFKLKIVNSK